MIQELIVIDYKQSQLTNSQLTVRFNEVSDVTESNRHETVTK